MESTCIECGAKQFIRWPTERGIKVRLPPVQPRSRLAHEAVAFARLHNKDMELHHAIFKAFFEFGEDIGKLDVLS